MPLVIPQPDVSYIGPRRLIQVVPTAATTYTVVGVPSTFSIGSGSGSDATNAAGRWINLASGSSVNNQGYMQSSVTTDVRREWLPDAYFNFRTGANASDLAQSRIWMGLNSASFVAISNNDSPNVAFIGVRISSSASDSTIKLYTCDGASNFSTVDTGVTVTADTVYVVRFKFADLNTLKVYINDQLVVTHTANLPAASTPLGFGVSVTNLFTGATRNIRFGGVRIFLI